MSAHIDVGVKKNCYNPFESFGEICVGCGCCSDNKLEAARARLALHERLLEDDKKFDGWATDDPALLEIQKENVAADISWNNMMIRYYKAIIAAEEQVNG